MMNGEVLNLHPAGNEASNGNTSDFAVGWAKTPIFVINCDQAGGTSPTLDVTIETKDPISGEYDTIATFTQITSSPANEFLHALDTGKMLGNVIRVKWEIGGTNNPNFTFSVSAILKHN